MSTPNLYEHLSEKLTLKRNEHPSFQLMEQLLKTDQQMLMGAKASLEMFEVYAKNSTGDLKTPKEIVEESWAEGHRNHLMILGEGGIGKTICLLSLPSMFADKKVPAIYVPLNMVTEANTNGSIGDYIKQWILDDDAELFHQLIERIRLPWSSEPQLLLLLDGFNEISNQHRVPFCNEIKLWSEYPGIQIITSSRFDVRNNLKSIPNFSKIELQPLKGEAIDNYLSDIGIPTPQNKTAKELIGYPLLLALYAKTELFRLQSTTYKEANNAGSIIWNYLQSELLQFQDKNTLAASTIALELIAPHIAWRMQQKSTFTLDEDLFSDLTSEAFLYYEGHLKDINQFPSQIKMTLRKASSKPTLDNIYFLLEERLCLFVHSGSQYMLIHQHFRDALAALHLVNSSYLSGNSLPQEWNTPVDHYVMQFVVDLIGEKEADHLWEQNRKTIPAIDDATRNQLRLQGLLHNNNFTHLNFSGLELSNISLFPYCINKTINLPIRPERLNKTKLSDRTFSPEGHEGFVTAIAITPDGKRILSGSNDETIRIWDLETGTQIGNPIRGRHGQVSSLALSPDGKRIVSGSRDGVICVWDVDSGAPIGKPIKGHKSTVFAVAVTLDGLRIISGSSDRTIRIWNLGTGTSLCEPIQGHCGSVLAVAVTPDNKHIISGSMDSTIRVWEMETGKQIGKPIKGHKKGVNTIAVTPNGKCIVSGSYDKNICIWDLETRVLLKEPLKGHKGEVNTLILTSDGKKIISGSTDTTIRIWDIETGLLEKQPIEGRNGWVNALALTPDGKRIVSGAYSNIIRVWDYETGNPIGNPIERSKCSVNSIAVTEDGRHIISGTIDSAIRVWDTKTGALFGKPIEGHKDRVSTVAVTPDGKRIVSGSEDHTIRIWDLETGTPIGRPIKGHENRVNAIAVTPDGKRIVSGSWDHTIRVWDLETGTPIGRPIKGHENRVNAIAVTSDGKRIVSGSWDHTIRVWNLETGEQIGKPINGHESGISAVAVTPNDKYIISGSRDTTIRVWDLETHNPIRMPIQGHMDSVLAIAVTNSVVFSGSQDKTIRVWNMQTGNPIIKPITKHEGPVRAVAVTREKKHIVSGGDDGTICITDLETSESNTIHIHPLSFVGLDFSLADISDPELKETLRQNGAKVDPD